MNTKAYFRKFGGQFEPETVMFALDELSVSAKQPASKRKRATKTRRYSRQNRSIKS